VDLSQVIALEVPAHISTSTSARNGAFPLYRIIDTVSAI
jgi:hypothetical protein